MPILQRSTHPNHRAVTRQANPPHALRKAAHVRKPSEAET